MSLSSVFQELSSLLSMHGFQSLEDFAGLKESHLNELNITDPEQRSKILNASDLLRDCEFTHGTAALTCPDESKKEIRNLRKMSQ